MDSKSRQIRLLVTTGDVDGIGWEVTAKALRALGPKPGVQFVYYRHESSPQGLPAPPKTFKLKSVSTIFQAADAPFDPRSLIEIRSPRPPALWVEEAAHACLQHRFDGLVTAPLSKTSILEAGLRDIGHTEILGRVARAPDLFMGFIGRKFSVVLVTGHQPLKEALASLSAVKLRKALIAAHSMRTLLGKGKRDLPLAMVGVNPHAGEQGLIGSEEGWIRGVLESGAREFGRVDGPLVPDAAFLPRNWKAYSVFVCPYHDQGLVPFKMVHGFSGGVHLTLGLPFVRTSVDHGTAKELFGKNKAESGSMQDALETAIRLCKLQLSEVRAHA